MLAWRIAGQVDSPETPAMWTTALLFDDFTWHGKAMSVKEAVPRSG